MLCTYRQMGEHMTGNGGAEGRYCIIHGHFYQPPRENPWINIIEAQNSAAPAHDWNERVYDECYRPNAYSRILDPVGMIDDIFNNYRYLSFNFGPTLFLWLEKEHRDVTERIIAADSDSRARLDSHGNAIAQVYNHIILPLASRRDKLTQIRWAKSFFHSRFGREPEGMWLSETAIDMETVLCLVEEGIRFVVLSPAQADAFRRLDADDAWRPTAASALDTRCAYRIFAQTEHGERCGGYVDAFFFDEQLSKEASFGSLLSDAHELAGNLSSRFSARTEQAQAVVLATDGETFGHHKAYGDMCLAYFFAHAAPEHDIIPVNFGYFLANNPPRFEVRLAHAFSGGTAWSCAHGTGRWRSDCGCQTGGPSSYNQKWRAPLRAALDGLQAQIDAEYENFFAGRVADVWKLRDNYEQVMNDRSPQSIRLFLERNGATLPEQELITAGRLLEAQKYALFMFTSCAWFFADINGLEAMQNLRYACRALQLALSGAAYRAALGGMLDILDTAKSNIGGQTGKTLFEQHILPFSRHRELLCFAAAVEKVVSGSDATEIRRFGYTIGLRRCDEIRKRRTDVFIAAITDKASGERGEFSICIRSGYSARTIGYVLPFDITARQESGFANLKKWMSHPQAMALRLGDIFTESKAAITKHFMRQIARNTRARYCSWMRTNDTVLGALAGLNGTLPAFLQGPVVYLLTSQWNTIIDGISEKGNEEDVLSQLLELHRKARMYGIRIDYSRCIALIEELLIEDIAGLERQLSAEACDRIRYLLNIVDRFSIPIAKHKIEDAFYPLLQGSIAQLHEQLAGVHAAPPDQKRFLLHLLSFARRMNFSTSRFPLEQDDAG
jgi:hypothetical protein